MIIGRDGLLQATVTIAQTTSKVLFGSLLSTILYAISITQILNKKNHKLQCQLKVRQLINQIPQSMMTQGLILNKLKLPFHWNSK